MQISTGCRLPINLSPIPFRAELNLYIEDRPPGATPGGLTVAASQPIADLTPGIADLASRISLYFSEHWVGL